MESKPYSYHTFLLPFELKISKRMKVEKKSGISEESNLVYKEIDLILNKKYWREEFWLESKKERKPKEKKSWNENSLLFDPVMLDEEVQKDLTKKDIIRAVKYSQEQYFHRNVKKAIHNDGEGNILKEYAFRFLDKKTKKEIVESIGEHEEYFIVRTISKDVEKEYPFCEDVEVEYALKVSNIRLKVFNTGVCVLILDLQNYKYRDFKSVKEINELARRISLPFVANEGRKILSAQEMEWSFLYYDSKTYSYKEKNENFWSNKDLKQRIYMVDFIQNMIVSEEHRSKYEVLPSLDDRMFTCCLIQDNMLSQKFEGDYLSEEFKNIREYYNYLSKSLYEFIYIDKDGDCSAPTNSFREKILNESMYHRWTEYGTIYGVSHTSFVGITAEYDGLMTMITRPFLTQYVEIAILVLVQRASILRFQKKICGNMNNKKIQKLQSEYINYRNQLHFFEVSSQEQGIELYELIRKQLYIEKEMEALEKNLEILYEKNNVDHGNVFNRFGVFIGFIAILSIILDLVSFILERDFAKNLWIQFEPLMCELFGIFLTATLLRRLIWMVVMRKDRC